MAEIFKRFIEIEEFTLVWTYHGCIFYFFERFFVFKILKAISIQVRILRCCVKSFLSKNIEVLWQFIIDFFHRFKLNILFLQNSIIFIIFEHFFNILHKQICVGMWSTHIWFFTQMNWFFRDLLYFWF